MRSHTWPPMMVLNQSTFPAIMIIINLTHLSRRLVITELSIDVTSCWIPIILFTLLAGSLWPFCQLANTVFRRPWSYVLHLLPTLLLSLHFIYTVKRTFTVLRDDRFHGCRTHTSRTGHYSTVPPSSCTSHFRNGSNKFSSIVRSSLQYSFHFFHFMS